MTPTSSTRAITGVVYRVEGELLEVTMFGATDKQWIVGDVVITARVGASDYSWNATGKLPALGDTVEITVPA